MARWHEVEKTEAMDSDLYESGVCSRYIAGMPPPREGGPQTLDNNNNNATPPPPPPYTGNNMDDGRTYHQERNYIDFNVPRTNEFLSNQNRRQQQTSTKSVNTRSNTHHYDQANGSFMSAFSKADNERRREFQPFRDPRRNEVSARDQFMFGTCTHCRFTGTE